ncbi:MAG: acyl carrier protein [Pseudomonadota bacterium]
MDRAKIFDALSELFLDVMDMDEVDLSEATTADDIEEWDSLSHVRLVVSVEREFGVKFTNADIEGFKTVGDLVSSIMAKQAA